MLGIENEGTKQAVKQSRQVSAAFPPLSPHCRPALILSPESGNVNPEAGFLPVGFGRGGKGQGHVGYCYLEPIGSGVRGIGFCAVRW